MFLLIRDYLACWIYEDKNSDQFLKLEISTFSLKQYVERCYLPIMYVQSSLYAVLKLMRAKKIGLFEARDLEIF